MLLIHFMDTIEERANSIGKAYEFGQTHTLIFIYRIYDVRRTLYRPYRR